MCGEPRRRARWARAREPAESAQMDQATGAICADSGSQGRGRGRGAAASASWPRVSARRNRAAASSALKRRGDLGAVELPVLVVRALHPGFLEQRQQDQVVLLVGVEVDQRLELLAERETPHPVVRPHPDPVQELLQRSRRVHRLGLAVRPGGAAPLARGGGDRGCDPRQVTYVGEGHLRHIGLARPVAPVPARPAQAAPPRHATRVPDVAGGGGVSPGTAGPVRTTDAHLRRLGDPRAHICADSAILVRTSAPTRREGDHGRVRGDPRNRRRGEARWSEWTSVDLRRPRCVRRQRPRTNRPAASRARKALA